eukprot:Nitzschia sp. Nitz4//scaffold22_size323478//139495//141458//NITZ4_000531-RA/size323478-augustus-gene-0.198-mRNA-1//1//CDS//3329543007//3322//frame0
MDPRTKFFARMEAERKNEYGSTDGDDDFDVNFTVTESGRTVQNLEGDDMDDMDFSIIASARTLGNTDRSMATVGTIDTNYTECSIGTVSPSILDSQSAERMNSDRSNKSKDSKSNATARPPESEATPQQSNQQHFQPLLPLPEHPTTTRSAPRAIQKPPAPHNPSALGPLPSQPGSAGSTASSFLNNITDPAASTFNNTHMSHTPPNHLATSYEASHFGKRARAGSISERLKVSAELEQKGMIDRDQKGILKDLIISGQDNELQHALDKYEQGDTGLLETMLQNGTLSNRARNEIDLLGDLDLDFLNVTDSGMRDLTSQNIAYNPVDPRGAAAHHPMGVPAHSHMGYEASDGIGELDFDGGMEHTDAYHHLPYREPSPVPPGQRSRSNSTFSVDLNFRQRSNSLFSALIGNVVPPHDTTPVDYGRWMERGVEHPGMMPVPTQQQPVLRIDRSERRSSAPDLPSNLSISLAAEDKELTVAERKSMKAEEKRREREEKKQQKEREKREKKERKEQAKLEKQRKNEAEEKVEHEPGSGRPRSMSDPNIKTSIDANGLLHVERPEGWVGAYSPESRRVRIARFLEKRNHRVWTKTVKYDVRKNFADSRLRVKGRFVKKEDELLMRELMSLT